MWTEIRQAYRDSFRVARAAPLLFALPAAAEAIQHLIEYRIGMFASLRSMEALADHDARMGFGMVKILSLILLVYWVNRKLAAMDGARLRVAGDGRSALLFAGVLAWSVAVAVAQQFGGAVLAPYVPEGRTLTIIGFGFFILVTALEIYLTAWKSGAALGNPRLGIAASLRIMHGNFWWSLGYFVAMFLPLVAVHYALNGFAIGRPDGLLWTMLALDSLVVGYLGIVLAATLYITARRATGRAGVALAAA